MQKRRAQLLTAPFSSAISTLRKLQRTHVVEELLVVASLAELVGEELHGFYRRERVENFAEDPSALEVVLGDEEFFFTRSTTLDVDGRKDALVDELAVEDDFHVAGALELFEDDFVHTRAGIDEGAGDDGERATFFDVAGRSEEALGALQGVRVHTT